MTNLDTPRVYSKEEIVPGIYGWMDCPNWIDHTTICEVDGIDKTEEGVIVYCGHWMPIQAMDKYGKSNGWRLWNKKPTMEQRRSWPWVGTPDKTIEYCFEECGWTYYD